MLFPCICKKFYRFGLYIFINNVLIFCVICAYCIPNKLIKFIFLHIANEYQIRIVGENIGKVRKGEGVSKEELITFITYFKRY